MENPYSPEDKVLTKQGGVEVEATVRITFNDEVQVRTPDGILRWRNVRTVWRKPVDVVSASDERPAQPAPQQPPQIQPEEVQIQPEYAAAPSPQEAPKESQEPPQENAAEAPKEEVVSCGLPEVAEKIKRTKKGRRRK